MDGQVDGWVDGCVVGWEGGWVDVRHDRCVKHWAGLNHMALRCHMEGSELP